MGRHEARHGRTWARRRQTQRDTRATLPQISRVAAPRHRHDHLQRDVRSGARFAIVGLQL